MMFKLIAVTDAGDISGEAFLRTSKSFVTTCVIETVTVQGLLRTGKSVVTYTCVRSRYCKRPSSELASLL